jgi:GDP-4-dehydro-6-deoxy-D-mannose reductase
VTEGDLPVTEDFRPAPDDTYGISKLAQTLYGLSTVKRGQSVVIGRFFNVIGAGMPEHLALGAFVTQIARMGREGGALITGDLDVERDFVEAADVARLVVELIGRTDVTGVVNICSGKPTSLKLLVDELVRRCPVPIELKRSTHVRGITSVRRHFGAPMRLRALRLPIPVLEPARAIEAVLRLPNSQCED